MSENKHHFERADGKSAIFELEVVKFLRVENKMTVYAVASDNYQALSQF